MECQRTELSDTRASAGRPGRTSSILRFVEAHGRIVVEGVQESMSASLPKAAAPEDRRPVRLGRARQELARPVFPQKRPQEVLGGRR